jgi:glycosyltransferase involved in cell wall biosynthesis
MRDYQEPLQFKPMELPLLSETPLVSVLAPNYNYAQYIGDALESMLAQGYPHFEVIVCDDGSSDDSCAVIERYVRQNHRFQLIRKANGGLPSTLNAAYAAAKGEIVCLLDTDDVFCPEKLEKIVSAFRTNPASGVCVHNLLPVSKKREPIDAPVPRKPLKEGWIGPQGLRSGVASNLPPASGLCFRRQVTDRIFPLPNQVRRLLDAYLLELALFFTPVVVLTEVLAEYRLHGDNITARLEPNPLAINRYVEDIATLVEAQRHFLATHHGAEAAECLRLDNRREYWENLLALYILEDHPQDRVHGYTADALLAQLPQTLRKRLWQSILALPSGVARRALYLWWKPASWKSFARPVAQVLGMR